MARPRQKPPAKHLLWRHGPVPLLALLRETVAPSEDARKVLQRERGYFTPNALRCSGFDLQPSRASPDRTCRASP